MAGCGPDGPTAPDTERVGKSASTQGQGDGEATNGSNLWSPPPTGYHYEVDYEAGPYCTDYEPSDPGMWATWSTTYYDHGDDPDEWCMTITWYNLVEGGDDDPPEDPPSDPPTDFWTESVGSRGVDCGLPLSLSRAERAYCRGSAPTGIQKSYIGMVLYAMSQKSALCDSIALAVDSMIDNNRFRFFTAADTADRALAVTWKSGVPQGWVALDSAYIASWYDSGHAHNVNGTMMDLSAQLAHIGEHLLRQVNSSMHVSGEDYTPNTLGCSDLP